MLAASFLPVAAFAGEGGAESQDTPLLLSTEDGSNDEQENGGKGRSASAISGPNQIKYYMTAQYANGTSRSEYNWDWSSKDGGKIEISYLDGLYPDHKTVSVTGIEVGSVILKVSGGNKDPEQFVINIGKRTVNLSSGSAFKTYDGRPLTGGISVDGDGWAPIDEDRVQYNQASRTDAGESENTFEVVLPSGSEEYFKKHYDLIITRYGVLRVEKRPVTLTSASGSKEYDGEPLTNHEVTVGEAAWGTGWVDGQGATYSFAGSQKIVGSSENVFECIPNEGTNLDNGFETLEFQINGQTFYVSGVEASATGTDAGEYPVTKSGQAVVTDAEGNDVTDQFTVNIDDAKLTIVGVDSDKSASNLPHTGDSAALYAMGICGVAIAAGAVAFVARRKGSSRR